MYLFSNLKKTVKKNSFLYKDDVNLIYFWVVNLNNTSSYNRQRYRVVNTSSKQYHKKKYINTGLMFVGWR